MRWDGLDEAGMAALARRVAERLKAGDVVALHGPMGAGKTYFAGHIIRTWAEDEGLRVTSPTFALVQPYPTGRGMVWHMDLHRLKDARELEELGLDAALEEGALLLVEWPEIAEKWLPARRVEVRIMPDAADAGRRGIDISVAAEDFQRFKDMER